MDDSTKTIFSLVISVVALAQVWVIAAWKRWRWSAVELFESHAIELGFSNLGPTIGLLGTLRARHRDYFVRALSVVVTRKTDRLTRTFGWKVFRTSKFRATESDMELAASFLLMPGSPIKYNILFVDELFEAENGARVRPMAVSWAEYSLAHGADMSDAKREAVFKQFIDEHHGVDAFSALDRAFYWKEGRYTILVKATSDNGSSRVLGTYDFDISTDDETNLRANVIPIQRAVCGLPAGYFFAFPKYQPSK